MIAPVSEREPLSRNRVHHGRDVGASHLLEVSDVPVLDHTIVAGSHPAMHSTGDAVRIIIEEIAREICGFVIRGPK